MNRYWAIQERWFEKDNTDPRIETPKFRILQGVYKSYEECVAKKTHLQSMYDINDRHEFDVISLGKMVV